MEDKIGEIVHQEDYLVSPTTQVFALIGVIWLSLKIFSFWRMIASLFILPGIKLSKLSKKGTWALITGASDGIGKEYALQLSAKGYNTILVSRTKTKLDALSSQIEAAYHTQTRVLAMDFAANNDKDFAKLGKIVDELEVGILVNNVGLSHSIPVPFVETEDKEMRDIITINCTGTLRVTALVAPGMAKRRKGLILTMASFGGILPTPLLATYSGSKAFLQQWSSALHSELQPYGVHVQLVQSYLVTSAMSKIKRPTWMIPTPRTFVRAALTRLGQGGGSQDILGTSTPYWAHAVYQWALVNFVGTMNGFVIGINKRMHEGIRKRALRKAEREKKGS